MEKLIFIAIVLMKREIDEKSLIFIITVLTLVLNDLKLSK